MSEKAEPVIGQPTNLAGLARLIRDGAAETRKSPPVAQEAASGANKRGHGALVEVIQAELLSRFSKRLSMEQIADCSHALAVAIAPARDLHRPPARPKSAARGIFQRPPGSGVWWISYLDAEGGRHREKIGERYAALDALRRRRLEVREGRFVPPRGGARLTFRDLATAAMAQKKLRLAPLSYESDQTRLRKLLPLIGNVPADRLTADRIEETLARLMSSMSGSTANRYRSLISSIYSFAVRAGKMTVNPVSRVKRFRENESRLQWLKPDQEKAIRAAFDSELHEAEFDLALHTGMRRGEQFGLRWKDVDLERGMLTVRGKSGRRHVVANSSAIAALRRLHQATGAEKFVSPGARDGAKRDRRRWFEKALEKAGIEDFHWHDLRHSFASRLVMKGVDIRTVQELLGHKSIVMTMRYSHLAQDHRQAAVEKMNPRGTGA